MCAMKTPGVYIVEKNAFPNSVVEVATAVPAFIGYTEKAENKGKSLASKPWKITSMSEFHNYFGAAPNSQFEITDITPAAATSEPDTATPASADDSATPKDPFDNIGIETKFVSDKKEYSLTQKDPHYLLYYSMLLFYQNGGGPCYIVSVGNYETPPESAKLAAGIKLLIKEQEPTMVLIPEAVLLKNADCYSLQQACILHCGNKMKSRVCILDVWDGYRERQDPAGDPVAAFRNGLGINNLDFASAYYPWVNTTIVQDKDISYENISNPDILQEEIKKELKFPDDLDALETAEKLKVEQQNETVSNMTKKWLEEVNPKSESKQKYSESEKVSNIALVHKSLLILSPLYNTVLAEIKNRLNMLPPSAAMAGIYTMVDNSRGVWKAPANVSLNSVISPSANISHDDQEDLNVTTQGKSINAIRTFIGEGTLVWGARTLDGNSLDWRYINVRRTMIMLEESIRLASKAYVFEPNVANTWVTMKSMIRNFLTGIWKRGGLAGAVPEDAFSVHVGLGDTMTAEDILEGILRITVLVAVSRPAEFIEITFQQQMQKS